MLEHLFAIIRHMIDTPGGPYFLGASVLWASRRVPKL
jgi:hypothetical protein